MGKTKTSKHRGSRTHGRGKKAGRGKGKRGGHGMAGTHKHKYMWVLKNHPDYFGMHGFKRPPSLCKASITLNINDLERLRSSDHVKVDKAKVVADLGAMGIDKLLGAGFPTKKYDIKVPSASAKAVEKIEKAGGKVEIVTVNKQQDNAGTEKDKKGSKAKKVKKTKKFKK